MFNSMIGPIVALLGVIISVASGTSAPAPTESGHEVDQSVPNYFHSPADYLLICAQFPSLAACQQGSLVEKRKSAYMRFGRSAPEAMELEEEDPTQAMEKRKSAYMRFGKRSPEANEEIEQGVEKRKSAYMRFGKRKSAYMRFGKRSSDGQMEKRKSAYMRFGKRSAVPDEESVNMEKRKSAYMRFGKRSAAPEEESSNMEKRKSAYMRFGKRR